MAAMCPEDPADTTASAEDVLPEHAITYVVTTTGVGDLETGTVLLDGQPIGRLSRRPRASVMSREPFESLLASDSVWHAEAIGWLPAADRPWDTRITSSAPSRRRAAEDLLRAYQNHR
jgi:hypothetical protein